jgi:hypothetical protein
MVSFVASGPQIGFTSVHELALCISPATLFSFADVMAYVRLQTLDRCPRLQLLQHPWRLAALGQHKVTFQAMVTQM